MALNLTFMKFIVFLGFLTFLWYLMPKRSSGTAKWIWDRSIFSIIKPLFQICVNFHKYWNNAMSNNILSIEAVLDRRPKFYGRSRRFKTYGYGYGGRSLRPFLRPKVFLLVSLVFFSKMEAEMCFSLHRCHLRLMWNMILLLSSLKIKTGPFLMKFL